MPSGRPLPDLLECPSTCWAGHVLAGVRLAGYAGHSFPPERATQLAPMLASALAALRALRLDEYDDLQPGAVFQVPSYAPSRSPGRVPPEA